MSKKIRALILFGGIAIIVLVAIIISSQSGKGKAIDVTVEKVQRGDITQLVSGTGKIQPEVKVNISGNVAGKIVSLPVREGDYVEKDQLLVQLEREQYEAIVEQSQSTLKSARANLKKSKAEYERMKQLYEQKLSSIADLEAAEAQLMLSEANVEQATASLTQANDNLSKTTILSPIAGTITLLNKEMGEIALGSTFQADVIMVVSDLSRMEVLAEIDENDVVEVDINEKVNIEVDAIPDTILEGRVTEIAHTASTRGLGTQEEVTNFEVKIAVIDKMPQLRPGMSATVEIESETHTDVLHVPIQSITMRIPKEPVKDLPESTTKRREKSGDTIDENVQGRHDDGDEAAEQGKKAQGPNKKVEVVFVVEDDVVKMRPIATGLSSETNIEIISGLEEGETIVTGSYRVLSKDLKDESLVNVPGGEKEKDEGDEQEDEEENQD